MTPRSSCPGEEYHSSPGRKPPAHYRINTVAENCAGGELAATSPGQARRGRGSATDCLGHFWQADLGHFSRAPKLPPYLIELIKKIDSRHGKYLFVGPESLRMETVSDLWRRKIARVLTVAKVDHGHPHRFRHTFAVELLKNGVPIEDVSTLLGHSSVRITEQHYSAWTKARQDILKAHVEKTWKAFGVIDGGRQTIAG